MSNVVGVTVEVEVATQNGFEIEVHPCVMGYALLLGELVVYDLDGMDIAHYEDYESISSHDIQAGEDI